LLLHVANQQISKYAVPEVERIEFVTEIPKTSVGKIDKKLLRQRVAGVAAVPTRTPPTLGVTR
jgi:fatty-acyl-CoA synthase